jgi:thiol-disulfide isomerase/thioredoxin
MREWLFLIGAFILVGCAQVGVSQAAPDIYPGYEVTRPADALPGLSTNQAKPMQGEDKKVSVKTNLPDYGAAEELNNKVWLNSDSPLRLKNLRGKVVLLDMWTLGCINCQHVIPYLNKWYTTYQGQGLVIIGNHYPEFNYERDLSNLKEAVKRFDIAYPVAQDNDGATWNAYRNRYWPTIYLIDKAGRIRYIQIGEGAYAETDKAIQDLLAETYP